MEVAIIVFLEFGSNDGVDGDISGALTQTFEKLCDGRLVIFALGWARRGRTASFFTLLLLLWSLNEDLLLNVLCCRE